MRNRIIFLIGFILIGCSDFVDEQHLKIDPIAKPSYDKFIKLALENGIDFRKNSLIIEIGEIPSGKHGLTFYESIKRIRINVDYVNSIKSEIMDSVGTNPKLYLEYVIMHELGHALLLRTHAPSDKFSIMTCCMETAWYYTMEDKRPILQKELFSGNY